MPDRNAINTDTFPRGDAEEIFAYGFKNIADKYIKTISADRFVMAGLKRLSSLDASISVVQTSNQVQLQRARQPVATFPVPDPDDTAAWAYTAALVTAESRKYSSRLMAASEEDLYEIIFDGALLTLDKFSRYVGHDDADKDRAKRDGYGGIGILMRIRNKKIIITKIHDDSPARKAGLQTSDEILSIEGTVLSGLRASEIIPLLRGPVGSTVKLTINNFTTGIKDLEIERTHIIPKTVTASLRKGILHLKVKSFNHGTVNSIIKELKSAFGKDPDSAKGIILDLRGNPGGLLKQSVQMADIFLTQGNILDTRGRHIDSLQHYEAGGEDAARGLPVVVLIDGGSASASEIVAAALQDSERAVVMGTVSYGKGTVQTVIRLPNSGELILTWSRFITPSGYALHRLGVYPAICTSGISETTSPELLETLERQTNKRDTLSLWHRVTLDDLPGRTELREYCPPERHKGNKDLNLARLLIENSVLYYRALDMTTATVEVQP